MAGDFEAAKGAVEQQDKALCKGKEQGATGGHRRQAGGRLACQLARSPAPRLTGVPFWLGNSACLPSCLSAADFSKLLHIIAPDVVVRERLRRKDNGQPCHASP